MPWLALHILLPLLLLAAIALDWALAKMLELLDTLAANRLATGSVLGRPLTLFAGSGSRWPRLTVGLLLLLLGVLLEVLLRGLLGVLPGIPLGVLLGVLLGLLPAALCLRYEAGLSLMRRYGAMWYSLVGFFLLLIPMLYSMLFVTFVDPGEAPHEMLSYVQTTPDVTLVMSKIATLDQELYHGQHLLRIGVDGDNTWPFAWYLRDYTRVYWGYNGQSPAPQDLDVLLVDPGAFSQLYMADHPMYQAKEYRLRAWWDEGYKPLPPCELGVAGCSYNPNTLLYGDGLGQWLSYGDNVPPQGKTFDLGKAASNLWNWLWTRKSIGSTSGSTDFMFLVRAGLPVTP
jgi:hypothetical protein